MQLPRARRRLSNRTPLRSKEPIFWCSLSRIEAELLIVQIEDLSPNRAAGLISQSEHSAASGLRTAFICGPFVYRHFGNERGPTLAIVSTPRSVGRNVSRQSGSVRGATRSRLTEHYGAPGTRWERRPIRAEDVPYDVRIRKLSPGGPHGMLSGRQVMTDFRRPDSVRLTGYPPTHATPPSGRCG
jgi:hypothetical protein